MDIHPHKVELIEKNAVRYGVDIIRTAVADASKPQEQLRESADFVLCDVPCSGMGIIRKKPDIRFKKQEDVLHLPELQSAILHTAAGYVKPGGRLLYSTCTVLQAENEEVVRAFLADTPGWELAEMRTFWPHVDNTDGFFTARLERL